MIPVLEINRAIFAVCPGGEGAVLKTVGCKRLAGSNPVYGVYLYLHLAGYYCNSSGRWEMYG